MPAPHVTTTRPAARKRPVPAATSPKPSAARGVIAERAACAVERESVDPERRRRMIAEAAYYRAEARGFAPGSELQDWLAAEAEVETLLRA